MFSARQAVADLELEPFEFEGADGETYQLPNFKSLTVKAANRALDGDFLGILTEIGADDAAIDQVTSLPVGVLEPLVVAWMEHAGSEPGESAASSRSIGRTARPSKPTSRSGGSTTRRR